MANVSALLGSCPSRMNQPSTGVGLQGASRTQMSKQMGDQLTGKVRGMTVLFCALTLLVFSRVSFAQVTGQLELAQRVEGAEWIGLPVLDVELRFRGELWKEALSLRSIQPGDLYSPVLVRRVLNEIGQSGKFADFSAKVRPESSGVVLVIQATPRRMIQAIKFEGDKGLSEASQRALGLERGTGVTFFELVTSESVLKKYLAGRGYPAAEVQIRVEETDAPNAVVLRTLVVRGQAELIAQVQTSWLPREPIEQLSQVKSELGFSGGERFDAQIIDKAANALKVDLIERGFYRAEVSWQRKSAGVLQITIASGPFYQVRIEGLERYGHSELVAALKLNEQTNPQAEVLAPLAKRFLTDRGFYDAAVDVEIYDDRAGQRSEIFVRIAQGQRVRVTQRVFPCLKELRSSAEINREIDGVLAEEFPNRSLLTPPDPQLLDEAMGGLSPSARAVPIENSPWANYSPRAYQVVKEHLEELLRADG